MNNEQITADRQERVKKAKEEIELILRKYELDLQAEDQIGEHTKISVMLQFRDTKNYPEAKPTQPINPLLEDVFGPNTPIGKPKKNEKENSTKGK